MHERAPRLTSTTQGIVKIEMVKTYLIPRSFLSTRIDSKSHKTMSLRRSMTILVKETS